MEVDVKSLHQGSDEVQDFPCSPCAKENKNVAAVKHCVECDENLCKTCLDHHNKFSVMKGHQLLDTVISPSGQSGQRPELPSQRCDRHGGKLIDVYCPGHDKVGCSTCIAVEHGACRGISFIPDLAEHSRSTEELQLLETAIKNLQSYFVTLKQKKQNHLENLKKEKDKLLREIRSERKKINDQLDEMEKELLDEVGTIFQMKLHNIDADITKVGETIASLEKDQQKLKAANNENASEKYVQVKLGKERRKIANDLLGEIERSEITGKVWFDSNNQICSKNNIIGGVINCSAVEAESFIGEFEASVDTDNTVCDITDMCLDTDGNIVMADYNNKRIKKMNRSYTITSYLTVGDNPYGICQIDKMLLAVTLINKKKVQFVSRTEPITFEKSFTVGDRCRGIAYRDSLIYVCCGGSRKREGVGHLEVYTTSGSLLTSFYGEFECPVYVTVPKWTTEVYLDDVYGDLFIINVIGGTRKISSKERKLQKPRSCCWLNRSQMCIAGESSNNIVLISSDGKLYEELLTGKDGITNPLGICFDEKQSRLVVSMFQHDKIKVYKLKISNI